MKQQILISGKTGQKLLFVKKVKECTGLGLKESKLLVDNIFENGKVLELEVEVSNEKSLAEIESSFTSIGLIVETNMREKKLKRVLYKNQKILMKNLLSDISQWETNGVLSEEDKEELTYNQCRLKAIETIHDSYSEYIKFDLFTHVFVDIQDVNKLETKSLPIKFIKFNEEFGEMCAEYLKFAGYTYKPYNKEELVGEMADSLQVLLSIYSQMEKETGITITDVLNKVLVKNQKWRNKINDYTKNN